MFSSGMMCPMTTSKLVWNYLKLSECTSKAHSYTNVNFQIVAFVLYRQNWQSTQQFSLGEKQSECKHLKRQPCTMNGHGTRMHVCVCQREVCKWVCLYEVGVERVMTRLEKWLDSTRLEVFGSRRVSKFCLTRKLTPLFCPLHGNFFSHSWSREGHLKC